MPALKVKPERDFPSMNAIHGIRGWWEVGGLSLPLTRGVWVPIGTVPANAVITDTSLHIAVSAVGGTTPTFDLTATESAPATGSALIGGAAIDAAAGTNTFFTVTAGLGYKATRRQIYARLNATADLTAGKWSTLVQYYLKQD